MKTIIKYVANDGSEWHDKEKAMMRDALIIEVAAAMTALKDHPTDSNWEGYVRHSPESILKCKTKLFNIADRKGILKWWLDSQRNDHKKTDEELISMTHPSWFGRLLDGGHGPLTKAYGRLCCIDHQHREWNQPYFANNPGKGEDVCVG